MDNETQETLRRLYEEKTVLQKKLDESLEENKSLKEIIRVSGGLMEHRLREVEERVRFLEAREEQRERAIRGVIPDKDQSASAHPKAHPFSGSSSGRACMKCGLPATHQIHAVSEGE